MLSSEEFSSTQQPNEAFSSFTVPKSENESSIHTSESSVGLNKEELKLKDLGNEQKLVESDIKDDADSKIEKIDREETTLQTESTSEQTEINDNSSTPGRE